jgi:hypothetical protein
MEIMGRPDKLINKHKGNPCPEDNVTEWMEVSEVYPERSQVYAIIDENEKSFFVNYRKKRDKGNWICPYSRKKVVLWYPIPNYYPRLLNWKKRD